MPHHVKGGYCSYCGERVMVSRQVPDHVLHLLLTVFLCTLWLPVWLALALFGGGDWRCTQCGGKARCNQSTEAGNMVGLLLCGLAVIVLLVGGLAALVLAIPN